MLEKGVEKRVVGNECEKCDVKTVVGHYGGKMVLGKGWYVSVVGNR